MIITVIPGDGIGPSIVAATTRVLDHLACDLEYEYVEAGLSAYERGQGLLPELTIASIARNRIALKGPLMTPIGGGFSSLNVQLRQRFDLFANIRPAISFPGVKSRYDNIDLIVVRENTEGLYIGKERFVDENKQETEAIARVTRAGATRIIEYAFAMAKAQGRKKLCVFHKANILKIASGLFLTIFREVAAHYPEVQNHEMIIDNGCMQLVLNPYQFDMIVTTNMFGDIISDLCAGLVGGLGMAPSANIGKEVAIFEAVHGSAPDIADKNIANPSALMLSAALMLDHIGNTAAATRIRTALTQTLAAQDRCTPDLGGDATTTAFTDAIIQRL